jgi:PKD repeat protein
MTTDVYAAPAPVIVAQQIAYEGQEILIDGSQSVNAQSFEWNFGDNTTSTDPEVVKSYASPGNYTITLTINGNVSLTRNIAILPYLPAPYQEGTADYHGDFESTPEHFASNLIQGTPFQRGSSTKAGKDGTHSGTNAWVTGLNDNLYQNNTRAELYTPMYDMTEPGLYEFKFWSKFAMQNRNDGFQVEYSLDAGATWLQLGTTEDVNWYNYHNINLADGAFPTGKSYFTNAQLTWTQYIKDVSSLAGHDKVSFRFVFRSDDDTPAQGVAIDDVQLTKYQGELKTIVTVFNAQYTADDEVEINWTTGLEYQCQYFTIERSYTGFGFEPVGTVNAKGVVSTFPRQYKYTDLSLRSVIFYRLHVVNANPEIDYAYDYYTDTVVVRRDIEADVVHLVLSNPFTDKINVSFSSYLTQEITARLYDMSGKLIREEVVVPNNIAYSMDNLTLLPGVYLFSIQIGENDPKTYKLLTLGS